MRAFTLFASVLAMTAILMEARTPAAAQRGGGAAAPAAAAPAANTPTPPGNADNGKKIFSEYGCYECHGWMAQGGGAGARLAPRPIPFAGFVKYVRRPTNQMPPYTEKVVPNADLEHIHAYLMSKPAPPAASTIPLLK